jgi:hypothetical protein
MSHNTLDGLTPRQEHAVVALLNHPTVAQAAQSIGMSQRAIYRWLDQPAFSRAYRRARREAFAQAIALTQRYAPAAVHTLARIMADESAGATARVSAATALLKFSRESVELDDLADRVDQLERAAPQLRGDARAWRAPRPAGEATGWR